MIDFNAAISSLPSRVRWVSHGRDPRVGLDCIGFVLAAYRLAGVPIDDLDLPYGSRDESREHRVRRIVTQLESRFRRVDRSPESCRPGDVVVLNASQRNHLGVVAGPSGGFMAEMSLRGLRQVRIGQAWPHVVEMYRHPSVN